jgi:hypothetical protein
VLAAAVGPDGGCCIEPTSRGQLPVPAQQRPWRDEETLRASAWQLSSRSGEKCPVGTFKTGPLVMSPKDTQFVTKHDDLEILGGLALTIWDHQDPEQRSNQ